MEKFTHDLRLVEDELKSFRIQRYNEFPDIDLYMEQVVSYVNRNLEIFNRDGEHAITPSMINNYVKYGIIPAPDKKKYKRRHIAYIYAVYFLKQVLTMSEIKNIIDYQVKSVGEKSAYEFFCEELEHALKSCCRTASQSEPNSSIDNYALKHSLIAIANKLYAQRIIELQNNMLKENLQQSNDNVVAADNDLLEPKTKEEKKAEKRTEKEEKKAKNLADKEERKAEKEEKKVDKKAEKVEKKLDKTAEKLKSSEEELKKIRQLGDDIRKKNNKLIQE